jgi:hypothetical protein
MPTKPALGYPSRTEAALALQAQGHSLKQIADKIGIPEKNVEALLYSRTRARTDPPAERGYVIKLETIRALAPEAQRRCMTVGQLAEAIIARVAHNRLVGVVMDMEDTAQ